MFLLFERGALFEFYKKKAKSACKEKKIKLMSITYCSGKLEQYVRKLIYETL